MEKKIVSKELREEAIFRESVRQMRQDLNWSQKELAIRMAENGFGDYNQTTVSRLESGNRPLTLAESRTIARIFNTTIENMVSESTEELRSFQQLQSQASDLKSKRQSIIDLSREYGEECLWLSIYLTRVKEIDIERLIVSSGYLSNADVQNTLQTAEIVMDLESLLMNIRQSLLDPRSEHEPLEEENEEPDWEVFNQIEWGN